MLNHLYTQLMAAAGDASDISIVFSKHGATSENLSKLNVLKLAKTEARNEINFRILI